MDKEKVYFQVVTTNDRRARGLQEALGGKSVRVHPQVDEDLAKTEGDGVSSLEEALRVVQKVSEYKAARDWINIGAVPGVLKQIVHIGKPPHDTDGYGHIARLVSDSMQAYWVTDERTGGEPGPIRLYNKLHDERLYGLHNEISGRKTAIMTALTSIVVPLGEHLSFAERGVDWVAHMRTTIVMTQYHLREISQTEYTDALNEMGVSFARTIAGGVPFARNRFIDTSRGFTVAKIENDGNMQVLWEDTDWNQMTKQKREQCVFGAFPEVMGPLVSPLPKQGTVYTEPRDGV